MRKTVAYFLGIFLAFTLGYVFLDPAFLLIADWLGPLFGSPLLAALMSAFLLFGNPLRFIMLSALWGSVAFLGGLIIRRRVGAAGTMVSVFLFFLSILAASIYGIIQKVSELGPIVGSQNPFSLLPPLPRGLSLAKLAEAPIIGRLIESLPGLMESGGPDAFQGLVREVITPLLIDFAEKIVIVCLAALVGAEVGKRVERRFTPWSESLRIKLGGKSKPSSNTLTTVAPTRVLPIILVLLSVCVFTVPLGIGASDGGYFSENLLGFVDDRGSAYVAALFLDSEMSVGGFNMESTGVEGLLATVILTQDSILDAIPDIYNMTEGFDVSSLFNLVPPTALIMVYVDVPSEVAAERAGCISPAFSDAFGIRLSQLIALSPPLAEEDDDETPQISVVVYQSPDELRDLAEAYLNLFGVERGGLAEVVEEAYRNGRLIPGENSESADGAIMFAGFINLAALGRYMPLEELDRLNVSSLILPSFDAPLGFSGCLLYWERGVESPPNAHSFDLLRLLGVEPPVSFSSDANLSNLLIVAPNQTLEEGQVVKLVTTAHLTDPGFEEIFQELAQRVALTVASPGSLLDRSYFGVTFSALLPLDVQVSKEVTPPTASTNGEVQVTVTVKNNDNYPMEEVAVDDGETVLGYQMSAEIVSGSTKETWWVLEPGESRTLTYTVRLGSGGVYTLRPATVHYLYEDEAFDETSSPAEARVSHPSAPAFVTESVKGLWTASAEVLNLLTNGNGSTIVMASTLGWVALLAFMEVRGFKKWLAGE